MGQDIREDVGDLEMVMVDEEAFAYRELGHGDPVVLVHGGISDLRTWDRQLPALGEHHRTISLSRRYARPNDDIPAGADDHMGQHVEDLIAVLETTRAAPAHLVGNSWGAFICLLTAIRRPDLVRTLVLEEAPVVTLFVSTPPRPSELLRLLPTHPRAALAVMTVGVRVILPAQLAFRTGRDADAVRLFAHGVLGRRACRQLSSERIAQMWQNRAALRAQLLGAGFPPLSDQDVRAVTAPTLLLTGQNSPRFLRPLTSALEELLPNAHQVTIPSASHLMHEDNAEFVNRIILDFLRRHA